MDQRVSSNLLRFRLYREHKYLFSVFTQLLQKLAGLDLLDRQAFKEFKLEFKHLADLLTAHAQYEDGRIHALLKAKGSCITDIAETEHREQHRFLEQMANDLEVLEKEKSLEARYSISYELYLKLRKFFGQNLAHFEYEEKVIMPELQRLATDEEIKAIDHQSYKQMSSEQLVHMLQVLFPHFNPEDRLVFLADIQDIVPEKFILAWPQIANLLPDEERARLLKQLSKVNKTTGKAPCG